MRIFAIILFLFAFNAAATDPLTLTSPLYESGFSSFNGRTGEYITVTPDIDGGFNSFNSKTGEYIQVSPTANGYRSFNWKTGEWILIQKKKDD